MKIEKIENIADWLRLIIKERISEDLLLVYDEFHDVWKISIRSHPKLIAISILPNLYKLGTQPYLACPSWNTSTEGLTAIETNLPAPGLDKNINPMIEKTDYGFYINYDIFGLTYWMLARCEEVNPPLDLLDSHQRFPAASSHAFLNNYLERPIVDEWIGILRQVIQRLWPQLPLIQHQFKLLVSHDVDAPSAYGLTRKRKMLRSMAAMLIKHRSLIGTFRVPQIYFNTRKSLYPHDPFNTFDWLMDNSEEAEIRSAFYFICSHTRTRFDAQYNLGHPAIRNLMRHIHTRGHEIGLHPSYNTFRKPERLVQEAKYLQTICNEEGIYQLQWGGRMHFLRWQWPITAHGWEQAEFQYDSTLSYADRPGFRCGTCHEYPMYDPVAQRPLRLRQRPLIVMDVTLLAKCYLGLGYTLSTLQVIERLKKYCQSVDGQFTLLWHNSNFQNPFARIIYQAIFNI